MFFSSHTTLIKEGKLHSPKIIRKSTWIKQLLNIFLEEEYEPYTWSTIVCYCVVEYKQTYQFQELGNNPNFPQVQIHNHSHAHLFVWKFMGLADKLCFLKRGAGAFGPINILTFWASPTKYCFMTFDIFVFLGW